MKFHQLGTKTNETGFQFDKEKMNNLLENLFPGTYLISFQRLEPKSSIKDYRRCYFAKVDFLAAETGHSRYEMHGIIKDNPMTELVSQLPELMEDDEISTKSLSLEGWIVLLDSLDLWAFTTYNVILP